MAFFSDEQIAQLQAPLEKTRVSKRTDGKRQLSYLEGFDVIDCANRIFGYGMWERGPVQVLRHAEQTVKKDQGSRYDAHVVVATSVTVYGQDGAPRTHHDVGYGNGNSYSGFAESYELAYKEAVTDAMKRCLRVYGNQFGNSLYDKDSDDHKPDQPPAQTRPPANSPPDPPSLPQEGRKQSPDSLITEPQRKRLYAISKQHGWVDDQVKKLLAEYGYASSKEVKAGFYDYICLRLEAGPVVPAAGESEAGEGVEAQWEA